MSGQKQSMITFKADKNLLDALKHIENRSDFIRSAIFAALDHVCPLCSGSGILSSEQKTHWNNFAKEHQIEECDECHEIHLVCAHNATSEVSHQTN